VLIGQTWPATFYIIRRSSVVVILLPTLIS